VLKVDQDVVQMTLDHLDFFLDRILPTPTRLSIPPFKMTFGADCVAKTPKLSVQLVNS